MKMVSPNEIPLPGLCNPTDPEASLKQIKVRSIKSFCLSGFGLLLSAVLFLAFLRSAVYLTSPGSLKSVTFNLSTSSIITPSPCTDFYEYACSSTKQHLANIGIPSIFSEAKDYNEKLIISALSSGRARHGSASRAVSFLVGLYRKWESESKDPANQLIDDFDFDSADFRYVLSRVYVDAAMAATSRSYIEALRGNSTRIAEKLKSTIGRLLGPKDGFSKRLLQRVTSHVGYEDWYMNDTQLDTWYGLKEANGLKFKSWASFRENMEAWRAQIRVSKWTQMVSFTDVFWDSPVGWMKPWAMLWDAQIFLPLGYLFPSTYQHTSSHAATYGTLGFATGHEWLHNLHLPENPSFKNTAQCLIEQYSAIREPQTGRHLRGAQTIREDLADNGAIKVAFDAYREDPKSEVTPQTDGQFFLSFARQFCSIDAPKVLQQKIETDVHSLAKYRINVVLSNFETFSRTFSCPIGAPMNPVKKCTFW